MSGSVNKAVIIGHLGQKPDLKYLPSGQAVCEMRIATSEKFEDKSNQKQERTEWHSVTAWGKIGENCAKYLDKGRQVYVEGRLQTRTWDDKTTGEKKYKTEIVATNVQFLGGDPKQERGERSERGESGRTRGYSNADGSREPGDDSFDINDF